MKTAILIMAAALALSCNNNASSRGAEEQNNASIPKTLSDTLYKAAMEGHDAGMAKMGEIARYQQLIQQRTDSLAALKSKTALQPALDSALQELTHAEELMNRWMQDFDPDKAGSTEAEKVSFYRSEKEKIDSVNARIFKSIEKAKRVVE
ncbi:hypothetical protein [Agriterribacter sp.]|uniref:hypothetical protein n=1 Tax=Agriterribacter sp. TaxID=2821509 RepID=UPI002C18BB44|nr:hypothetical protein [Agriterribacter sp.]HRO44648.1 hypothetical protein [Agriterribacter sp.]HRQ16085.1 hypothetical protein [Agriterribacter sp.]